MDVSVNEACESLAAAPPEAEALIARFQDALRRLGHEGLKIHWIMNHVFWAQGGGFVDFLREAGRPHRLHGLRPDLPFLEMLTEQPDARQAGFKPFSYLGLIEVGDAPTPPVVFGLFAVKMEYDYAPFWLLACGDLADAAAIMRAHDEYRRERVRGGRPYITITEEPQELPQRLRWDEVFIAPAIKARFRNSVETFFASAELYRSRGLPHKRGVLLVGPPGNGKTALCKAAAHELGVPFVYFTAHDAKAHDALDGIFRKARRYAPAILCMEDLDSFFSVGVTLSHFLNLMDGFEPLEGVLVIATTNHPECLDPAITARPSRFDDIIAIAPPALAERQAYLRHLFAGELSDRSLRALAHDADGLSGAAIKEVYVATALAAARDGRRELSIEDARRALERLREMNRDLEDIAAGRAEVGFHRPDGLTAAALERPGADVAADGD